MIFSVDWAILFLQVIRITYTIGWTEGQYFSKHCIFSTDIYNVRISYWESTQLKTKSEQSGLNKKKAISCPRWTVQYSIGIKTLVRKN